MAQTADVTRSTLSERMQAAREMALAIAASCQSYAESASPATVNRFLDQVERLADVAEAIEVERTVQALDSGGAGRACCAKHTRHA